jgi:hypothetical protein
MVRHGVKSAVISVQLSGLGLEKHVNQLENQILLIVGLDKNGPYSLDYYISGTDSCKGDSGGGLYTWRDGAPTLMGVVSRYSRQETHAYGNSVQVYKRPTLMGVVFR